MRDSFTTVRDLRQWVEDHMGPNGNDTITDAVTEHIRANDHPAWGDDWAEFLDNLDLWDIADELGL